jgi:hypothetical protein
MVNQISDEARGSRPGRDHEVSVAGDTCPVRPDPLEERLKAGEEPLLLPDKQRHPTCPDLAGQGEDGRKVDYFELGLEGGALARLDMRNGGNESAVQPSEGMVEWDGEPG